MPAPDDGLTDRLARFDLLQGAPADVLALCQRAARPQHLAVGELLLQAGEHGGRLFLVLQGRLAMRLPGVPAPIPVAEVDAGGVLGEIQAVTGLAAETDAVALTPCTLRVFDRPLLQAIGARFAPFEARLAQLAMQRLRALIFRKTLASLTPGLASALRDALADRATETLLARGACLMQQGEPADAWYVLTSGRLSVSTAAAAGPRRNADLLPGASVGEIGLIAGGTRSATVRAERDASLMRVSRTDFEHFADQHPAFARRLMGTVVQRLVDQLAPRPPRGAEVLVVLRASAAPRLQAALDQLGAALQQACPAALCTRADFEAATGRHIAGPAEHAPAHPLWHQFDLWLAESQRAHGVVLLDAGVADDLWSRECLLHADRCLWLAEPVAPDEAAPPPAAHARLQALRQGAEDAGRLPWSLLVAHDAAAVAPSNTRAWLEGAAFERHFHLRLDDVSTMARAARLLTGRGHGLALSGGAARGLAHIGVLKAFGESGVPIDVIGGTSMGALQAAMYAMGLSMAELEAMNRYVIAQKPFGDYTLPLVALVASRRRDACIRHTYGDLRIEDLWLPFLAVSTDLNAAEAVVHERGSLGLAVAASASIPGVLVPVTDGARVLVDGGVVNNLPADLVKLRCGGTVFASKVAPSDELRAPPGGFPSPWALLWNRLWPGRAALQTPKIGDLIVRTMTVGGEGHMQRVARDIDVLIEPDVDRYGMFDLTVMGPLVDAGWREARRCLAVWQATRR